MHVGIIKTKIESNISFVSNKKISVSNTEILKNISSISCKLD